MVIDIYVDFDNQTVMSKEEYESFLHRGGEDLSSDEASFSEWLNDRYTPDEVWGISKEQEQDILTMWQSSCEETFEASCDVQKFAIKV